MLATVERSRNPYSAAIARGHAMNLLREIGDVDATVDLVERQIAEAEEQKLNNWIGPATCARGWVLVRGGEVDAGIAEMRRGLEQCEETGFLICRGYLLASLAEAQLGRGDVDDAIASLDRGLALCESSLDRFHQSELLRLKGECLKTLGDLASAETHFRHSLELARGRRSKSYELRAAQSLASLLGQRGAQEEAAELLQPLIAWFRAGHEVPDLRLADVLHEIQS